MIGLGLVEFRALLGWVGDLTRAVGGGLGADQLSTEGATVFATCLVVSSFGLGLLLMYLWTSTRLLQVYNEQ